MSHTRLGRPRTLHSKQWSGVGEHKLTDEEHAKIHAVAKRCGFHSDEADFASLLTKILIAYSRFLAIDRAMNNRDAATPKNEMADIQSILKDARHVRALLSEMADLSDAGACVESAARFAERLENFPSRMAGETTRRADAVDFLYALMRLAQSVGSIRHWSERRNYLVADIDLVTTVCRSLPTLKSKTKREKTARHIFERELGEIYFDNIHPARQTNWEEVREPSNDPPPPSSHRAFARGVMQALNVEFESKRSEG